MTVPKDPKNPEVTPEVTGKPAKAPRIPSKAQTTKGAPTGAPQDPAPPRAIQAPATGKGPQKGPSRPQSTDELIRADFRNFVYLVWKHLQLPDPTPRQYAIANTIQKGSARQMIKAWRGAAKSWITAAYVLWSLYCRPEDQNIVVFSASKSRADAFTTFCLRLIREMPILAHLRPREGQRESMVAFDVGPAMPMQTPSVISIGITGQATGHRADKVIADDVETMNNSETVTMRERLSERIKEFEYLLKPGGRIIFLGTDQVDDSVYKDLPDRGYEVSYFPVRYPSAKDIERYQGQLDRGILDEVTKDPLLVGKSTEPTRFPDLILAEREMSVGKSEFEKQYMVFPGGTAGDAHPLKCSDCIVAQVSDTMGPEQIIRNTSRTAVDNELPCVGMRGDKWNTAFIPDGTRYVPFQQVLMYVDPAGRGKDETGYAVIASLNGYIYLLASGGLKGYGEDSLVSLATTAKRFKVQRIVTEPNFGDGMFNAVFKPVLGRIHACSLEEGERSQTQKERRIIGALEPLLTSHRLVVSRDVITQDFESVRGYPLEDQPKYRLFYQMTRLTSVKGSLAHDDRLDALAGACRCMTGVAEMDVELAQKLAKERRLDEELKAFERDYWSAKRQAAPNRRKSFIGNTMASEVGRQGGQTCPSQ